MLKAACNMLVLLGPGRSMLRTLRRYLPPFGLPSEPRMHRLISRSRSKERRSSATSSSVGGADFLPATERTAARTCLRESGVIERRNGQKCSRKNSAHAGKESALM